MKQIRELIERMEIESDIINFDNAALSYMPKPVLDALHGYNLRRNVMGPEYSSYWDTTEEVRTLCARKIGAEPEEIFFIQNTSMGLNFIAKALKLSAGDNVIISDMEFPSNVYPWLNLERDGVEIRFAGSVGGRIEERVIDDLIDEHTKAVSISWVVAANGSVTDIKKIGEICKKHQISYIIDGIQGLGQIPVNVKEVGCDFFVSGFFKWMMGPDGIGFVYIRRDILDQLEYPWLGWAGMKDKFNYGEFRIDVSEGARRYETGNMNFSALCGLKTCLEFTDGWEEEIRARICELIKYLRSRLQEVDGVEILSDLTTISGITLFRTKDTERTANELREKGFRFSVRGGIRISLHFYNQAEEIDLLIQVIKNSF